jgi:hypothetical protein
MFNCRSWPRSTFRLPRVAAYVLCVTVKIERRGFNEEMGGAAVSTVVCGSIFSGVGACRGKFGFDDRVGNSSRSTRRVAKGATGRGINNRQVLKRPLPAIENFGVDASAAFRRMALGE